MLGRSYICLSGKYQNQHAFGPDIEHNLLLVFILASEAILLLLMWPDVEAPSPSGLFAFDEEVPWLVSWMGNLATFLGC